MSPRNAESNEAIRHQTKKAIIDAAFELFAKEGYAQTSISSIAKKAGISKGLIYHYFTSKEEILAGIFHSLESLSDDLLNLKVQMPAVERLKLVIEGSFYYIKEMTGLARLTTALILQPEAIAGLKENLEKSLENKMDLAREIFGELGIDEPELEAFYLGAKLDGIMLGYFTLKDEYPMDKMKQKILNEYVNIIE
jgi:AcrR family transcriptional regulator